MQIEKITLQQHLELLQKCSSASVNEDVSDKIMFHPTGIANVSRGRMLTFLACDPDFEGLFPLENILKIIKAMSGDEITLTMDGDELKISSSKTKLGLKPLVMENWKSRFIESPFKFMSDKEFKPLPTDFIDGIMAVYSCAMNKAGSILSNVAVIGDNLVASDNYKIGNYRITKKFKTNFLIDFYNIEGIVAFNPTRYCLCEDRILFMNGENYQMCAVNPIGKYPDFFPVINRAYSGNPIVLPEELKESVNIAQQLPGKTDDSQMKLSLSKNKLALAYNTINGWFKRNIRINYNGNPIAFSMNVNVLNDALKNIGNELLVSEEGTGMMKLEKFNYVFPIDIEQS